MKELHTKNCKVKVTNAHSIKLLGMGDARYRRIRENLLQAMHRAGVSSHLEEIGDLQTILRYNVSSVPAILVDDAVIFEHGDIPSVEQLERMIREAAHTQTAS